MTTRPWAGDSERPRSGAEAPATTLLRETLVERATDVRMPADFASRARELAHRIVVRRRIAAACAVATCVAIVGVSTAVATHHPALGNRVAATSLLPHWPARGTNVHDTAAIATALKGWDVQAKTHHSLQEVLYAGRDSIGTALLVLATDGSGQLRLGGLVGNAGLTWAPEKVVVDRAVAAPLFAASLVHESPGRAPVLVLVTDPGYTRMTWDGGESAMGIASEDDLIGGFDILSFDDWTLLPDTVTLSGSQEPDRQFKLDR